MIHVTTTCPDLECARGLARAALNSRLAACASINTSILSLFHWKGEISEEGEIGITFKTLPEHCAALVTLIEAAHPYELPVITWEEVETTAHARDWVAEAAPVEDGDVSLG